MSSLRAHKGRAGTIRRGLTLPSRYGLTSERMRSRLQSLAETMRSEEITPTIMVTTSCLNGDPSLAGDLREFDIGVHGHRHIGYGGWTEARQSEDLDLALATLGRLDLVARGFRAPYLSTSPVTMRLLREHGLLFDSSCFQVAYPLGKLESNRISPLIKTRYNFDSRALMQDARSIGLVELPISLPDDEIIVDGLGIQNPQVIGRILDTMLEESVLRNSLLALQVHPERFPLFETPLRQTLRKARDLGAWTAPLTAIATWIAKGPQRLDRWPDGHSFAVAVTGDLDAMNLGDFARRYASLILCA